MNGISKLYCGTTEPSDALRYGLRSEDLPSHLLQFSIDKRPVVVWNITKRCNLKCVHCYAHATPQAQDNELSTDEGKALIDYLADFNAPVLLFSGGEPLMRKDLPELAGYAVKKGMRAVISTNGTLIHEETAKILKDFQKDQKLKVDGKMGMKTFSAIAKAFQTSLSEKPSPQPNPPIRRPSTPRTPALSNRR